MCYFFVVIATGASEYVWCSKFEKFYSVAVYVCFCDIAVASRPYRFAAIDVTATAAVAATVQMIKCDK